MGIIWHFLEFQSFFFWCPVLLIKKWTSFVVAFCVAKSGNHRLLCCSLTSSFSSPFLALSFSLSPALSFFPFYSVRNKASPTTLWVKHPSAINGIEQMFSVWKAQRWYSKPWSKAKQKDFLAPEKHKAKADIYGNDYITSLVSRTDACLAHMAN